MCEIKEIWHFSEATYQRSLISDWSKISLKLLYPLRVSRQTTFSISTKIQDGGQNLRNSTFFRDTTCNFCSTHRVQNLLVAGKQFLGKVPSRWICIFFFIFTQKLKILHCSQDKSVFAFYAEIQDGRQKWQKSYFCEMSPLHSADTLRVKTFFEIALSRSISKINAFLHFMQKFKMATKNGGKAIFLEKLPVDSAGQKVCRNHYLTPFLR